MTVIVQLSVESELIRIIERRRSKTALEAVAGCPAQALV
jgi:ferredoxin